MNRKNLILLVNLGSPDKLTKKSIRTFLRKFLSDKRVVGLSKILWYPILYGFILSFRPRKLINKYQQMWQQVDSLLMHRGLKDQEYISPLVYYTNMQAKQLNDLINNPNTLVNCAFSYSTPEISAILDEVYLNNQITSLQIIPLYPQYSSTTTASVFDSIANYYKTKKYVPSIKFYNGFADNEHYISAIADKIVQSFTRHGKSEKLIFSYHSIPLTLCENGDTYYTECLLTTRLIAQQLKLKDSEYIIAFQSKFGSQKWLTPPTVDTIRDLAAQGVKSIDVVCPGFVSDCLETLEEIAIMNKEVFLSNGGIIYNYIECLNGDVAFTNVLKNIIC